MNYESIESVYLAVPDRGMDIKPFLKLGWLPSEPIHGKSETKYTINFGEPNRPFRLQLVKKEEPTKIRIQGGSVGLRMLALSVAELKNSVDELVSRNRKITMASPIALACDEGEAGATIILRERTDEIVDTTHPFPIRRLDHLAAVAHDLEAQCRFWTDVLGVPLFGEVRTPTLVIRQFKIGDAIFELLGPASADSPIHKRPPGLISMVSLEVANLEASAAQARAAGFTISDPAPGALPRTRTATIPAAEASGLNIQLLEYV